MDFNLIWFYWESVGIENKAPRRRVSFDLAPTLITKCGIDNGNADGDQSALPCKLKTSVGSLKALKIQ
ncbi:hypothetical protein KQX54_018149 [Cotesia glomerata]|uniref:Uncharacterized protein n=1 Tax=Cotesia glomerata TaxID=32391 RepID=A0AAV7J5P7_COTGL|nr:hypothetical protein KQX54_018149 [Cotesia glomerata]